MSVWLTPDRKPFYGGTYFPPEDRWGRPGFVAILEALARAWAEERDQLVAEGDRVTDAAPAVCRGRQPVPETIDPDGFSRPRPPTGIQNGAAEFAAAAGAASEGCLRQLQASFDPAHGGFGGAPKFPRAPVFNFLFRVAASATADGGSRMPDGDDASNLSGFRSPKSEWPAPRGSWRR